MNEENIVSLSLAYYDKQKRKHHDYYKQNCRIELNDDGNDSSLPTYTIFQDDKPVNKGVYNTLGVYFKEEKQWSWGWVCNTKTKIETYLSRKVLNYALDMVFDSVKTNKDVTIILGLCDGDKSSLHS